MNQLVPVIIIILSITGGVVYVLPNYNEVLELREDEAVLDDGILKAQEAESIRQSLQEKLNDISEEDQRMLDRALPSVVDDIRLANDIQGIAASHNMDISNIKIERDNTSNDGQSRGGSRLPAEIGGVETEPILQTPEVEEVQVSFEVTAAYGVFLDFIADLQDSLQLFDLTSIKFEEAEEEYSFSIGLRTYALPNQDL